MGCLFFLRRISLLWHHCHSTQKTVLDNKLGINLVKNSFNKKPTDCMNIRENTSQEEDFQEITLLWLPG